ncbi:spermatogenesis-defective protein 39 homolog isoform X4 [Dendrobates tinctorius]|uniref:spermatogenesis-defective protein 39 homolog isoform X4 n=1 Tax=Dendrobates tinctorius TaxID=92724 RepID=UPI003CC9D97A
MGQLPCILLLTWDSFPVSFSHWSAPLSPPHMGQFPCLFLLLRQLKESKRAVNSIKAFVDEDDEEWEKFTWSGEPVGSISWSIQESSSIRDSEPRSFPSDKSRSEGSGSSFPRPGSFSSLFRVRSRPSSFQSFSDALLDTNIKYVAPELRKPKSEYQDYSGDWSIEESVRRMQRGKMCSMERFRSLKDKLHLLDEAVRLHDGNVITAVLIFLKRTLCSDILFRELKIRQVALRHFVHFLKETSDQLLLTELLRFLEWTEELAANDKHLEASGQELFRKYPRKASLLFMPLVTTLFYACIYHYSEAEGTFSSPINLRKTFKIPEKLYILTALAARAKLRSWVDVDALFTTKNWLGYTKKKAPIGFHRVVEILHKNGAPAQVLQDYTRLVEDAETRISLATKYKCHDVVIDTYRDLKDRHQLMVYRSKIERGSPEEEKIDCLLSNMQIRWKN